MLVTPAKALVTPTPDMKLKVASVGEAFAKNLRSFLKKVVSSLKVSFLVPKLDLGGIDCPYKTSLLPFY